MDAHAVYRPDLNSTTFTFSDGKCISSRTFAYSFFVDAFTSPITYPTCSDGEFNGKKVKIYNAVLYDLYVKDGEPIGLKTIGSGGATCDISFGSSARMGKFALSSKNEAGCGNDNVYKSGDDNWVFCAASSVKAALAVVLAALLVILF